MRHEVDTPLKRCSLRGCSRRRCPGGWTRCAGCCGS